jgi:hypothetical protein
VARLNRRPLGFFIVRKMDYRDKLKYLAAGLYICRVCKQSKAVEEYEGRPLCRDCLCAEQEAPERSLLPSALAFAQYEEPLDVSGQQLKIEVDRAMNKIGVPQKNWKSDKYQI